MLTPAGGRPMRALLLALLVVGSLAVVAPATVPAHEVACAWGDMGCWTKCQAGHVKTHVTEEHKCRWVFGP